MLHVNVASVIFGDPEQSGALSELNFTLATNSISVYDLIARTVENQVHDLLDNQKRSNDQAREILDRHYLVAGDVHSQAQSGKVAMPGSLCETSIDPEKEVQRAITAFEKGQFKVFVNGREFAELGAQISFKEAVKVKFMRIMPLIGG